MRVLGPLAWGRVPGLKEAPVRILLLSMPDSFEHMPALAMRMPNGALASLAGNVDRDHRVAVADLILVQRPRPRDRRAAGARARARRRRPVGHDLPAARRRSSDRRARPRARPPAAIVVGGYDPSLAPEAYDRRRRRRLHRARRGRAHVPRAAARARGTAAIRTAIAGLSWRDGGGFAHNAAAAGEPARRTTIRLPDRGARVLERLHAPRPPGRRRRDVARLHVRLQLLLDHRDARAQLPHLRLRARAGRHRATRGRAARARSSSSTTTSR